MQKHEATTRISRWFLTFLVISAFMCFATLFSHELPRAFKIFNLRNENNIATLFSGMFLLIIALQAFDGWGPNRKTAPRVASAWAMISLLSLALSFDEIGSLHERVHRFMQQFGLAGDWSTWWTLLPIGLLLIAGAIYALLGLFRAPGQRKTVILICIGFALLASVALQEYIEQNLDWTANRALRFFKARLRPTVEEGTELLGMLVLLWATLHGTRNKFDTQRLAGFPALSGVAMWRRPALIIGLIGAPVVAYVTMIMPESRHDHGAPADWPAAALYMLAALGAARPFFESARRLGALDWFLVAVALLGCASTILRPDSPMALPIMTGLSIAAFATWILAPRYSKSEFVLAMVLLTIGIAGAWLMPRSEFIIYTLAQYTGLAMYWVNASNSDSSPARHSG